MVCVLFSLDRVVYESVFFFFFSSRRRHTRCLSDWSSDVCSSDLCAVAIATAHSAGVQVRMITGDHAVTARSEERRVGKECRSRWSPDHEKKKKDRNVVSRTGKDDGRVD